MDDETLDRLVERAKEGDSEAFGAIFDAYAGPIHRFIASRVNRPSDAEDLTQLVFVKALEALPRYEARGIPFGGWLFRLARNAIIDQARTRRDHLSLVSAMDRATDDAGPEARAALRDDLDRVAAAIRDLTDDQREVIELRFFAGLSVFEAAVAMDREEGTIRGLQFRAIAALRRSLGIEVPARAPALGGGVAVSAAAARSAAELG
jgi:RNA polymerase sigma-70 factor (ECF subfamily)